MQSTEKYLTLARKSEKKNFAIRRTLENSIRYLFNQKINVYLLFKMLK